MNTVNCIILTLKIHGLIQLLIFVGVPSKHSKSSNNGTLNSKTSDETNACSSPVLSTPSDPNPTAELDRTGDDVYLYTMNVVCSVRNLLQGVQESRVDDYLNLVKVSNGVVLFEI